MMNKLPDGFSWDDYNELRNLDDSSKWAYLFAVRDPDFNTELEKGVGILRQINGNNLDQIPQLAWSNGVLMQGMKGHGTHQYLQKLSRKHLENVYIPKDNNYRFPAEAVAIKFISEDEYKNKAYKFPEGTIITSGNHDGINGYFVFENEKIYEDYTETNKAAFARTIELALNYSMPLKTLVNEVERIIIDAQQKYLGGIVKEIKIPRAKSKQWSRGLACWDLQQDYPDISIPKTLAPLWSPSRGSSSIKNDERAVRVALKATEPFINGEWRALTGDPLVSLESTLKQTQHTES